MSIKISKISKSAAKNCKIHPALYDFYLVLRKRLGASLVHRRKRDSSMCVEVVFYCEGISVLTGRLNTLKDAEKCGFWKICRPQTKRKHLFYDGRRVYQLFLSPVHPKKRREMLKVVTPLSEQASSADSAALG